METKLLPAALPYKGAPVDWYEVKLRTLNKEAYLYPSAERVVPLPVYKPKQKSAKSDMKKNWAMANVIAEYFAIWG